MIKEVKKTKKKKSQWEEMFALHVRAEGLPLIREHRFGAVAAGGIGKGLRERLHATGLKDWRFDFCDPNPNVMIAVEIEGGIFMGGGHVRGAGYRDDCHKYNMAALLGWTVLRFTDREVKKGEAVQLVAKMYAIKKGDTFAALAI